MSWEFLDNDGIWKPVADDDPIYGVNDPGDTYVGQPGWTWGPTDKDLEGQQYRNNSNNNNSVDIPFVFPKSNSISESKTSLPEWGLNISKEISSKLPGLMESYTNSIDALGAVPTLADNWVSQSGDAFLKGLGDFQSYIRKPLNKLASKGVIDSTITGDAITDVASLLADDWTEQQTKLAAEANQLKADALKNKAALSGSAAGLASSIMEMAKQSTGNSSSNTSDQLAYYQLLLNTLLS